jgi:NADH:ubiquinone oxidoreductase subunit 2 (subunit N)
MVVTPDLFRNLFIFIVVQSLVVGCFGALYHTRLKRILGFSSIFNVAAMLIPVVFAVDKEFCYAVLYSYIVFYTLTMIGIFLVLMYAQD